MSPDFQKVSAEKAEKSGKELSRIAGAPQEREQKPLPPDPPSLTGCWLTPRSQSSAVSQRDFMQADVLDGRPDNCEATRFCGEDVNLIGALAHIAKQAFKSIRRLNVPVHALRERIKRQEVFFILSQA